MSSILTVGLLLILGVLAGIVAQRVHLPRVVGYIIVGAICCPDFLGGPLGIHVDDFATPLTSVALGIIAYLIGGSITKKILKTAGAVILGCAAAESIGAAACVFVGVFFLAPDLPGLASWQTALILAAIAPATAPAGTIAVLRQYRAEGPLSRTLLGVVALDDAFGIILFALIAALSTGAALASNLTGAFTEIGGALMIGAFVGFILAVTRNVGDLKIRLPIILGAIALVVGIADQLHLSHLLACMSMGFVTRWFSPEKAGRVFAPLIAMEELIFVLFFTLAGAHFQFGAFKGSVAIVLVYCLGRAIGKVSGAAIGAKVSGAEPVIVRWLGLALLPQAGVAIGLALSISQVPAFEAASLMILNIILASTIINELLGPIAARIALLRAGEIRTDNGMADPPPAPG